MIPMGQEESSAKAPKLSEPQIAFDLKQTEGGTLIGEVSRKTFIRTLRFTKELGRDIGHRVGQA